MKIKVYSWTLASAYLLCGVVLFLVTLKFQPWLQQIYSGFGMTLPFLTKAAFVVGPYGWLLLAIASSTFVILKDLRFHSRLLSPLFTFILVLWVGCMAIALIYPLTFLFRSSGQVAVVSPDNRIGCKSTTG
jgi:hypothetical protein